MASDNDNLPVRTGELAMGQRGIQLRTYEDAFRFAKTVIDSGFAPKGMAKPSQVLVALQTGAEAGLTPMQSLASVVVVNGRASWMGDAAKAIVRRAGLLEPGTDFDTRIEGEEDAMRAVAIAHRRGQRLPVSYTFSVADAKRAGLWGKAGPWSQYPKRMLKYRAEGFLLRDHFSDALMGLYTEAEAQDIPEITGQIGTEPSRREPVPDPLLEGAKPPDPPVVEAEWTEHASAAAAPPGQGHPSLAESEPVSSGASAPLPHHEAASEVPDLDTGAVESQAPEVPAPEHESSKAPTAPVVEGSWDERGVCKGCARHRTFIEHQTKQGRSGHGNSIKMPTKPCEYTGANPVAARPEIPRSRRK